MSKGPGHSTRAGVPRLQVPKEYLHSAELRDIMQFGSSASAVFFKMRVAGVLHIFQFDTRQGEDICMALQTHINDIMMKRYSKVGFDIMRIRFQPQHQSCDRQQMGNFRARHSHHASCSSLNCCCGQASHASASGSREIPEGQIASISTLRRFRGSRGATHLCKWLRAWLAAPHLPLMGGFISIPAVIDLQLHLQAKQTLPDAKNAAAMAALAPKYEQHISELQAGLNAANDRCNARPCSQWSGDHIGAE